uniref:Proteasome assembly chaperone 3 n=1 Tax=Triticum urartu TaxID=4572 RepID=A0A8R7R6Z8_TRIUA
METPAGSAQAGGRFPLPHRSLSLDIKGNKTDIVISRYEDNFLVIVTQIGCMGTILAAKKDESVFSDPTYNVSVLFGKRDEPLLLACARQLIEHIRFAHRADIPHAICLHTHAQMTYVSGLVNFVSPFCTYIVVILVLKW